MKNYYPARRYVAFVSTLGTSQLHLRNPYIIAVWSFMFPGLGHMLLGKYVRGFFLFFWEVFVNYQAHINMAIFYSFTGDFPLAKEILDPKWMLLYIPTFIFAIRDSYRTTVDLNNQYQLAAREDTAIKPFKIGAVEINYLDKKDPWSSLVWSLMMPGMGQLSIHRIIVGFFVLSWWIAVVFYSNLLPAVHNTCLGNFGMAKNILNIQWAMNIPSIYFFAAYDAYVNTVESNKLFNWEQAKFLNQRYQNTEFTMPLKNHKGSEAMYIISTFQHSIFLEKAVTAVEMAGLAKEQILAVAMDKRGEKPQLFDSMYRSDGLPLLDISFVLSAIFALFGGIYGFNLTWGPLIWGLIGMIVGFGLGLVIRLLISEKYLRDRSSKAAVDVVLMIECKPDQLETVKTILRENHALGVRKLILGEGH